MPLRWFQKPFSHREWLFELKLDGYRALAHIAHGECQLVSRNGNRFYFRSLEDELVCAAIASRCVLYGELVCCGAQGRPQFNQLFYRRAERPARPATNSAEENLRRAHSDARQFSRLVYVERG